MNLGNPVCTAQDVPPCRTLDSLPSTSPSPTAPVTTSATSSAFSPITEDPTATQGEQEESDTLLNLNLTKETVIVLGIGVLLFIVLLVLVVVLVACIFHRRKPVQFRFKTPPAGQFVFIV